MKSLKAYALLLIVSAHANAALLSVDECHKQIGEALVRKQVKLDEQNNLSNLAMFGGTTLMAMGSTSSAGLGAAFFPFGSTFVAQGATISSFDSEENLERMQNMKAAYAEASIDQIGTRTLNLTDVLNHQIYLTAYDLDDGDGKLALKYRKILNNQLITPEEVSASLKHLMTVEEGLCNDPVITYYLNNNIVLKNIIDSKVRGTVE